MVQSENICYWDNAATSKVDQRVIDSMMPYFTEFFANASSSHQLGQLSKVAIEKARSQVASLINSETEEIIFTSGATESINLALKGFVESNCHKGNHIITVKTEHKAVLSTCEYLEQRGIDVTYLDVDRNGLISLEALENSIKPSTILISVMYVNNEIGVIQPIQQIGKIAKENSISFFCDATQAVGKIKVDVESDYIDMLSFSGHKINGPKGVGVLYKKKGVEISPLIHGGSQEGGLRAGTYNTPLIVGLGMACEISNILDMNSLLTENRSRIQKLEKCILTKFPGSYILVDPIHRIPNIINVVIPGLEVDKLIADSQIFSLSNGSACNSNIVNNSYVVSEILKDDIKFSFRISFGKIPLFSFELLSEFSILLQSNILNYA